MTHDEKKKLFQVLTLIQLLVYEIDELQTSAVAFQEVKMLCKRLSNAIIKKQGDNIKSIWSVEGGEETTTIVMQLMDAIVKEISAMDHSQMTMGLELLRAAKSGEVRFEEEKV